MHFHFVGHAAVKVKELRHAGHPCSPVRKVAREPHDSMEFTKGRQAGRVAATGPAVRVNRAFLAPRPTAAPFAATGVQERLAGV